MTIEEALAVKKPFGKRCNGMTLAEIIKKDPNFVEWLLKGKFFGEFGVALDVYREHLDSKRGADG